MKKIYLYFLLAIVVHLFLVLSIATVFTIKPSDSIQNSTLPAYIYKEEKNNPVKPMLAQAQPIKKIPVSEAGILPPRPVQKATQTNFEKLSVGKGQQNINLMLESKNTLEQPVLNILTKATAAQLTYPKIAIDFRLRGTSTVGFIMAPDGQISRMQLLHSSGNAVLDEEAMRAINAASPLKGVSAYLKKAEPFAFSIIFN